MSASNDPRDDHRFNTTRYENPLQMGGIRLGTLDHGGRVALIDTGSGLRFTVALDRGGDIIDAAYNQHALAFLTQVPLRAPGHAYNRGFDWLRNWPGGLVTTCGPQHIGGPSPSDTDQSTSLHGRYSNLPAEVEMALNPDLHRGRREMLLSLVVRDAKMFGPVLEVRRQIQCTLGEPAIHLYDHVINRGDQPVPHHWLYHVNLGYPLLDEGSRLIYRGNARYFQVPAPKAALSDEQCRGMKRVPAPLPEHAGTGERGFVVEAVPDAAGQCRIGLVNDRLGLGVSVDFPADVLPRFANWQHYGPAGCYVTGLEPFSGSLMGVHQDTHPRANQVLEPGQSIRYQVTVRVLNSPQAIAELEPWDGPVTVK
jgi:hypothetical protein